jgi:SAM-dependent MidA family methyltransferase
MDVEPGLRRTPRLDPVGIGDDPAIVERLRADIERDGAITFERFMTVALYDPDHGYYTGPIDRPTRGGDFLTAPELHPAFGRLLGRQLDEVWRRLDRPEPFVLREHGASSGTLGLTVVAGLRADRSDLAEVLRYEPVEVNRYRMAELEERWAAAGLQDRLGPASDPVVGAIVANELLDALPVHRVRSSGGRLLERFVSWADGRFVETEGPPSTDALAARLAADEVALADGQTAEICLALEPWLETVAATLERGVLLIIDYGHPAHELYGPTRPDGTLRVYVGHRVHGDPFSGVGRQDITTHVDLTAVERTATRAGLVPLGRTSLAECLVGLGIGELLADAGRVDVAAGADALSSYLGLRAAVSRLLDPRALGGFAVIGLGRTLEPDPPLAGFAWRLPIRPRA